MKFLGIIFLALFVSTGCTSISKDVRLVSDTNKDIASLLIYREKAFQAGAVSLYVGKDDKYFMELGNDEYGQVEIDAGKHLIQAKASGSPSSALQIELAKNQTVCLLSKPNPEMLGAMLIPLVANMVPTFVLEQVDCPSAEKLKGFMRVGL
ncbi:hypothetical protein [Rheinheimera baltica]|uniref:DUF2846 domain-containing protein n=1 Tax=Rheinheimera baltica TaxID=67576 RepID=A0ABT9I2Z2_9GAMM|nr:hypothetical protein [Rheinheimera baltica]MDP5137326.1 hypothetical protein [Rheinheimera baltica]MDP5188456.1 hypothetical protein [Rheinheimera baltica]